MAYKPTGNPPGRPRSNKPEWLEKRDGNPNLQIRVAPELYAWVYGQGGNDFVRRILGELMVVDITKRMGAE